MYVRVHAFPGEKRERVTKTADDSYEIVVREPAARNQANRRIREVLATEYGTKIGRVRLITGHRSPSKIFDISS